MPVTSRITREMILGAAVKLAETLGYRSVFKRHLADALQCGMGTINYHWGTMDVLRESIVHRALRDGNRAVLLQAVALHDPLVCRENLSRQQRARLDAATKA